MSKNKLISHFSRENRRVRDAKLKLKRILHRIALPKGTSLEERISIESIIDDIISARMEIQVELLGEFKNRIRNMVIETLGQEREQTREMVNEMLGLVGKSSQEKRNEITERE